MRILITGGNGFLGSHVVERLQGEHELRLLLRRSSDTSFLEGQSVYERVDGDLRDPASLDGAVQGIDLVIHLGGITIARTEAEYQAANAIGTANLIDAAV